MIHARRKTSPKSGFAREFAEAHFDMRERATKVIARYLVPVILPFALACVSVSQAGDMGETQSDSAKGFTDGWAVQKGKRSPLIPYLGGGATACLLPGLLALGSWTTPQRSEKVNYAWAAAGSSLLVPCFVGLAASTPHLPPQLPEGRSGLYSRAFVAGYEAAWQDNASKLLATNSVLAAALLGITLVAVLVAK